MRVATIIVLTALLSAHVLARVGETFEEAGKRYGDSLQIKGSTNSSTRVYEKEGIHIDATYFTNNLGKAIIGQISYTLSLKTIQMDRDIMLSHLLEANAEGQKWKQEMATTIHRFFRRPDATAHTAGGVRLTVTLDEYMHSINGDLPRIGETLEEFTKLCGAGLSCASETPAEAATNTFTRIYKKHGSPIQVTFFLDKAKKIIIGQISLHELDGRSVITQSNDATKEFGVKQYALILPLLEASAGGMKWENAATADDETFQLHRLGAKAIGCLSAPLTVTLDEYADFLVSDKKHLEAGQADRIGKQLRDF